jgi:predicted Zn finger-like uncharacterized protein
LPEPEQRYRFVCPNCSANFSIQPERIPPVQARFACPHCKEPMDFPSREEARLHIRLQAEAAAASANPAVASAEADDPPPAPSRADPPRTPSRPDPAVSPDTFAAVERLRFRIEKPGFQSDVFDRRDIRNLIRTREIRETDQIRVEDADAVMAGDLPYLRSLFRLANAQKVKPPGCCRTHTDRVAFFQCHDTGRPLCEPCAPEKKFGGQTIRVCQHCGGTAVDLPSA